MHLEIYIVAVTTTEKWLGMLPVIEDRFNRATLYGERVVRCGVVHQHRRGGKLAA